MLSEGPLAGKIREIAERIKAEQAARLGAKAPPPPPIPEALRLPAPAPETPVKDLILEYRLTLERLYLLDAMGGEANPAECRVLLQHQWKLADELGPEFAEAVDRQYRRDHGLDTREQT